MRGRSERETDFCCEHCAYLTQHIIYTEQWLPRYARYWCLYMSCATDAFRTCFYFEERDYRRQCIRHLDHEQIHRDTSWL